MSFAINYRNQYQERWTGTEKQAQNGDSISRLVLENDQLFNHFNQQAGGKPFIAEGGALDKACRNMTINGQKLTDTNGDNKITWKDVTGLKIGDTVAFNLPKEASAKPEAPAAPAETKKTEKPGLLGKLIKNIEESFKEEPAVPKDSKPAEKASAAPEDDTVKPDLPGLLGKLIKSLKASKKPDWNKPLGQIEKSEENAKGNAEIIQELRSAKSLLIRAKEIGNPLAIKRSTARVQELEKQLKANSIN